MPLATQEVRIESKSLCQKCGGECCKTMGCHFAPSDFEEISLEYLSKKIDEGYISIDWWDGDPRPDEVIEELPPEEILERAPYLRMRNLVPDTSHPNNDFTTVPLVLAPVVDPGVSGICCLLTHTGCPLSYDDRPKGGRMLIPDIDMGCNRNLYPKRQCAIEWIQYIDILEALIELYEPEYY